MGTSHRKLVNLVNDEPWMLRVYCFLACTYEGLDNAVFNTTTFSSCFLALCWRRFIHVGV